MGLRWRIENGVSRWRFSELILERLGRHQSARIKHVFHLNQVIAGYGIARSIGPKDKERVRWLVTKNNLSIVHGFAEANVEQARANALNAQLQAWLATKLSHGHYYLKTPRSVTQQVRRLEMPKFGEVSLSAIPAPTFRFKSLVTWPDAPVAGYKFPLPEPERCQGARHCTLRHAQL